MNIRRVRNVLLTILLAAACVGAAELFVCRFMEPDLYEQITMPVRNLYHGARSEVKDISGEYALWLSEQSDSREHIAAQQREQARLRAEARRLRAEERARQAERTRLARTERKRLKMERGVVEQLLREAQIASGPAIQDDWLLADPAVTELVTEDGQEYLTGGGRRLYYYNQKDEAWASVLYGRDPIGGYGCGPTALAMMVSSLRGERITPAEMAAWAADAGYAAPGSGSYLSIVNGTARKFGYECESLSLTADALTDAISDGGMVIALMGPGHFTAHGHFILLHGVTLSGEILVADPNSRENSLTAWDPEVIIGELSASRSDGSPLWVIRPTMEL